MARIFRSFGGPGSLAGISISLLLSGCSGTDSSSPPSELGGSTSSSQSTGGVPGSSGSGGALGVGGATGTSHTGGGGSPGSGGTVAGTGGTPTTGGTLATGGSKATGGATVTITTGGTPATGGAPATGGSKATGGATATITTGGTPATGGSKATGGATVTITTGGTPATGGSKATGGTPATGGSKATGGTPATGGAKATGGTPATGGTTSVSACGVNPVSPNATQQTKNLLCYLYSQYKNHVLTGQQEANWNANPTDVATIYSDTGKYPAVLGSDFLYRDSSSCTAVTSSTTRAIAYWNAGGITMFRYHMGMPGSGLTCSSDCYQGANCAEPTTHPTSAFFTNVITAGTAENTSLNAKLDYVAVQINAMKAANVPIILAIYHETQANGWFWWAIADSGAQFIALWKYTFNYLTATKGLNNIVWLMPFSGSPSAAYYPGSAFVDIGGPDQYTTPSNLLTFNASGNWSGASSVFGSTMPITMHETGSAIQPGSAIPSYPWVLFNVWAGYETNTTYNTAASLTQAYNNTYAVTRDKIPSLK